MNQTSRNVQLEKFKCFGTTCSYTFSYKIFKVGSTKTGKDKT